MNVNRQSAEVIILVCAKERRGHWILGAEIVPEWREHRDEPVVSICQGKNAERIEGVCDIGDSGEQPANIIFVDALGQEGNDSEKRSCIRAELLERW